MKFDQNQIEKMGAMFYAQGQAETIDCPACGKGQLDFESVWQPVLVVQICRLTCITCRRSGFHPN